MKSLFLWLAFLAGIVSATAQTASTATIRPLTIGDTVPDIELTNLINYPSKTARLSDFRGKNIIVDFWTPWCTPCIELFPELDSLQKEFKSKLVVLAVTGRKKEFVETFIEKNKNTKNSKLIFVAGDTLLANIFPHGSVPHDVWINKNRQVEAVTSSEYINYSNVKSFANGQSFSFIHKDDNLSYNYEKPIEENNIRAYNDQLINKTTFHKYLPGLNSAHSLYKTDSGYFISLLNQSIFQLYQFALSNRLSNFSRQIVLEVKDTDRLFYRGKGIGLNNDEWSIRNTYCYQSSGNSSPSNNAIRKKILADLNSNLGLLGRLEKRKTTLYNIISVGGGTKPLKSNGRPPEIYWNEKEANKHLVNQKISMLIDYLNGVKTQRTDIFLFSNDTNISYNIDIELNLTDVGDIDTLTRQLRQYGLDLVKEEKETEVFVLSDDN